MWMVKAVVELMVQTGMMLSKVTWTEHGYLMFLLVRNKGRSALNELKGSAPSGTEVCRVDRSVPLLTCS